MKVEQIKALRTNLDKIALEPIISLEPIKWPEEFTPEQKEAIEIAVKNGLEYEICEAMFNRGMCPREALEEWDLL